MFLRDGMQLMTLRREGRRKMKMGGGASMFLRDGMQLMTLRREGRRKKKHTLYHRGIGLARTPFKGVLFGLGSLFMSSYYG